MRSEEFFNILDDMDDRIISEMYEDVQRPQMFTAAPRSSGRLPKLILSGAACAAAIAAVITVAAHFAAPRISTSPSDAPEISDSLSQASESVSVSDSGSDNSEITADWFEQKHINPLRRTDRPEKDDEPYFLDYEHGFYVWDEADWSPEDYELIAVDNGTVVFAEKISDAYGSGVIIKHGEDVYMAYGGLDPDTVTVSAGDTVTTGETLAHPKPFGCIPVCHIAYFEVSRQSITEELFHNQCDMYCQSIEDVKERLDREWYGLPDADGNHHIAASPKDEVKSVTKSIVMYAGTDSDGSGMIVALDQSSLAFIIYKGLDTTFPDDYEVKDTVLHEEDTIGYVGDSGDAYWYIIDVLEFEEFAEENGIDFYPIHLDGWFYSDHVHSESE